MERNRRPPRFLVVGLLAGAAFFAGLSVDHASAARRRGETYRPLDVFSDVLGHVENSYVEEVAPRELVYGAIEGLVGRLDPHSTFLRPEAYRAMKEETSGEFDGLGIELTVQDGRITVVAPLADSPGERAGHPPRRPGGGDRRRADPRHDAFRGGPAHVPHLMSDIFGRVLSWYDCL